MQERLTGHTTVVNPETGEAETFTPEQDVPDWAKRLITNPSAWAIVDDDGESHTVDDVIGSMSRDDIIRALVDAGLEQGADFPKSASKDKLADILRERVTSSPGPEE